MLLNYLAVKTITG